VISSKLTSGQRRRSPPENVTAGLPIIRNKAIDTVGKRQIMFENRRPLGEVEELVGAVQRLSASEGPASKRDHWAVGRDPS
jgi:hypothetical protein